MFIPVWLIVLVLIFLTLRYVAWEDVWESLRVLGILAMLATGLMSIYFAVTRERDLALLFGAPWLILGVVWWVVEGFSVWNENRLNLFALWWHSTVTAQLGTPEQGRKALARRAELGARLLKFYESIQQYEYLTSQGSAIFMATDLAKLRTPADLRALGLPTEPRGQGLTLHFAASGADYVFAALRLRHSSDTYEFFVVGKPDNREVLRLIVITETDEYSHYVRDTRVEVFHLGPWLRRLLEITQLKAEEDAGAAARTLDRVRNDDRGRLGKDFS